MKKTDFHFNRQVIQRGRRKHHQLYRYVLLQINQNKKHNFSIKIETEEKNENLFFLGGKK